MAYAKLPRTGPRLNLINSVSTIEESNVLIIFYCMLRATVGIVAWSCLRSVDAQLVAAFVLRCRGDCHSCLTGDNST